MVKVELKVDCGLEDRNDLPQIKISEGNLEEGEKAMKEKVFFAIFWMEQVFEGAQEQQEEKVEEEKAMEEMQPVATAPGFTQAHLCQLL